MTSRGNSDVKRGSGRWPARGETNVTVYRLMALSILIAVSGFAWFYNIDQSHPSAALIAVVSGVAAVIAVVMVYMLPTVVAFNRRHRHRQAIMILNLLSAWTAFGWIAALVWANMEQRE